MKSHLALITILDERQGPVDPGYGVGAPVDPGWGVRPPVDPGWGQGHPSPPHPWFPGHVGGGHPAHPLPTPPPVTPDNTLPDTAPPPQVSLPIVLPPDPVVDDTRLFELKYSVRYGWVLVPVEDETAQPKKK